MLWRSLGPWLANDLLQRMGVRLTEVIVGINRTGTSARDLRAALAVAAQTQARIRFYLDGKLAGPIYHPKVWLIASPTFRAAFVGSANLTREGLLDNVEAGVVMTDGGTSDRNEASNALDSLRRQLDELSGSRYTTVVDEAVIARPVAIGAIPEHTDRRRRTDLDAGVMETSNADELIGIVAPRARGARTSGHSASGASRAPDGDQRSRRCTRWRRRRSGRRTTPLRSMLWTRRSKSDPQVSAAARTR